MKIKASEIPPSAQQQESLKGRKRSGIMRLLARLNREEKILLLLFILTLPLVNTHIRGDGNEYYAYLRSIIIDGDVQFENEYRRADPAFYSVAFDEQGNPRKSLSLDGTLGVMPNGYMQNFGSVGPALLWTPAFLIAHGLTWALNGLGISLPPDGFSFLYRWLCALSTALFAFIGLLLAYQLAAHLTDERIALIATITIWFASPLPVYLYFLPFHNPALASFVVALFLWYWMQSGPDRTVRQWALWGLISGLMVEVYYITAIFLLIAFFEWLRRELIEPAKSKGLSKQYQMALGKGLVFSLAILFALIPHFTIKWIMNGSPFKTGYADTFFWNEPRVWQLGFSAEHGLFSWTPILLLAFIGLILLWKKQRWESALMLVTFAIYYYAVACYQNWHGISSFGSRFFIPFTSAFIIGLAFFIQILVRILSRFSKTERKRETQTISRNPLIAMSCVLFVFVIWNIGFIFQWGTNLVPNRGPVDFSIVARNQVTIVPKKMIGFVIRYLKSRDQVTKEIEQEDLKELPEYNHRR